MTGLLLSHLSTSSDLSQMAQQDLGEIVHSPFMNTTKIWRISRIAKIVMSYILPLHPLNCSQKGHGSAKRKTKDN
jgi:hypothetical protein